VGELLHLLPLDPRRPPARLESASGPTRSHPDHTMQQRTAMRQDGGTNKDKGPGRGAYSELVEWKGIEPSTFALRTRRSPS
jgi:hypothetical protein